MIQAAGMNILFSTKIPALSVAKPKKGLLSFTVSVFGLTFLASCAVIETDRAELKKPKTKTVQKTVVTRVAKINYTKQSDPRPAPIASLPATPSPQQNSAPQPVSNASAPATPAPSANNSTNAVFPLIENIPVQPLTLTPPSLLAEARISYPVDERVIGVVLPLSGKSAAVGQRVLRGLQLGLGIHQAGSVYKLAVVDSEDNSEAARSPIDALVKDDKAIAIVGGVIGKTAQAEAQRAQELGVPFLALSQKPGLTDTGDFVFRNALTPRMQIEKMLDYVMTQQNLRRFAILYPNDSYGIDYANAFWDEVLIRGGEITGAQSYSTNETDFRYPIQRLIGTYYGEARLEEFKAIQDEIRKSTKKRSKRKEKTEVLLPPIADFDAVFVPDSAKTAGQIAAMFAFNDVLNMNFLGPNIWNTPELSRRMGGKSGRVIFADGVPDNKSAPFFTEYQGLFSEEPGLIETQAYDAGILLREALSRGPSDRKAFASELASPRQVLGSSGVFETSESREVTRPTFLFGLEKGKIGLIN